MKKVTIPQLPLTDTVTDQDSKIVQRGNKTYRYKDAIEQTPTTLNLKRTVLIPGAPGRMLLFGTTEETASEGNTIFEFIGDVAVTTNLDQSVRFFLNDQEIRVDTFNNGLAGEARLVACSIAGTIQEPLPVGLGKICGTLEIAGSVEQDSVVYPRALMMIRTIVDDDPGGAGNYPPTKTVFYNRKVGGVNNTVPDEAGQIDKNNNLIWGTGETPSDAFPSSVGHFKGNNGGFAKFAIGDTGGANDHDEHLIWSEDTNAGRGNVFIYQNPIDGVIIRQGNAILRIRNGTTVGQTGRIACEGVNVFGAPRVTEAQRNAMTGLIGGEIIYNITAGRHQGFASINDPDGAWENLY